jgi:ADP-ribose pyrophosphatase
VPPVPGEAGASRLHEQLLDTRQAYAGIFFDVWRDRVRCADGHEAEREYIRHPGAVMIAPVLPDGRLVLERQYRHPLGRTVIEFPAGKLEPGEDPLECGQRELLEETGYRAGNWQYLGLIHNAIGYADEKILLWKAEGLVQDGTIEQPGEVLEVFTATLDELLAWIDAGIVTDVKTVIAAYWLERHRRGGPPPLRCGPGGA